MARDEELFRVLMHDDLSSFVKRSIGEVAPGLLLEWNWHLDLICDRLTKLASGEIKRLLICVPPRSLKSLICSVAFPAWLMGRIAAERLLCISYAQPLAEDFARQHRQVMDSSFYKAAFETRLSSERRAAEQFETTGGGGRISNSVHGTITGRGGDFIILDDPMKPEEAQSETGRRSVLTWMSQTLASRPNAKKDARILVVMQRLHEDDVAGTLMAQGGWEQIVLPAIAVVAEDHHYQLAGLPHVAHREPGELLHPARKSVEVLEQLRREMGSLVFAAQYQQNPLPADGNLVKRSWFGTYGPADLLLMDRVIQSWDTASKTLDSHDYSVCTTWGLKNGRVFLIDVLRAKLEMPELCRAVIEQCDKFSAERVLIEDKGSGTGLLQALRARHFFKGMPILPKGDKLVRFSAVTPMIEGGRVFLPEHAPWRDEYLHEICGFPATKNDDQTDSTSQALLWIQDEGSPGGLWEYMRRFDEERRAGLEDRTVHLRAPHGVNRVSLRDGSELTVGPDSAIWVALDDAGTLRLAGFLDIGP